MAKKKEEEKINLESILFKCRDILRQARNSGSFFEKRDMMLACCECALNKAALQRFTAGSIAVQSGIKSNIKSRSRCVDNR